MTSQTTQREFLRHAIATLSYRGGKALRDAPPGFETFESGEGTRTPLRILAHVGDLLEWMLQLIDGSHIWSDSPDRTWTEEVDRFYRLLADVDARLATDGPLGSSAERLFQGPVADAFTHVGQIAMLRRMAGSPVRGENYFKAEITTGRTGPDQAAPRREFD